jgi:glycosyltransferase involved in cell wall biosynthesis
MSRTCLLVYALPAPAGPKIRTSAQRAWALAQVLAGRGEEVTLLETAPADGVRRAEVAAAADRIGAKYRYLSEFPALFAKPLLPAIPAHRLAYQVFGAVMELDPQTLWVVGDPSVASTIIAARDCGLPRTPSRIAVVLDDMREYRRERESLFPASGRADIAEDALERRTVAGADVLFCGSVALREWISAEKWALPPAVELWPETGLTSFLAADRPPRAGLQEAARAAAECRVSVCIPYYEQPRHLENALEMIAAQSRPPHEVIVVDDGSKSPEAAAAFAEAGRKYAGRGWKFLRRENQGPAAARNSAAREASGDAILFCDADNGYRPDMIAVFARALSTSGADCVTCAFDAFRDTPDPSDPGYIFAPLGDCLELGLIENIFGDTNFIIRRATFESLGGFPADNREASEDWQFLLRLVSGGGRLATVPAILFDYRLAAASHSRRHSELASSRAALAPVLERLDPAWRRLWLHLAGMVRNPRLLQAEAQLEATRAELSATRESHETEAREWRRRDRMRRANAFLLENSGHALTAQLSVAKAEALKQRRNDATEISRLNHRIAATDETLARREDKIRRMQESNSWRATAPLRAARRMLLDRQPNGSAAKPGPSLSAQGDSAVESGWHFHHHIDSPRSWNRHDSEVTIRGWCFCEETGLIERIRARIGDRVYVGTYGLDRPDLLQVLGAWPQCARSGFKIKGLILPGDRSVSLEVAEPAGDWRCFLKFSLDPEKAVDEPGSYENWIRAHDSPSPAELAALRAEAEALGSAPKISILMPVFDPEPKWLARAIESVRNQAYLNWELCIADDASTKPQVRPILEAAARGDPRIKVVFRERNGHISAATNSALELATGEFTALFDHDDELAPHALSCVAREIADHPGLELIYTDEDKIDEQGFRFDPHFKPDWNPDLLNGQNYISHLAVFRTSTLRSAGGLREGFEGSQDWDLLFRVTETIPGAAIRHIPRVLYHWRASEGSTSLHLGEKSYANEAARRALEGHFARRNIAVGLRPAVGGHWQVVYPLPERRPLVSILIPTHNAEPLVRVCFASIFARTNYNPYEIILVDNRSDEPAALDLFSELAKEDEVRILDYAHPFNYSAIVNFAAKQARGQILCLLNNDIEVMGTRWLDELVSHAVRPEIGAVGARLCYPDMTFQHAGVITGLGGVAGHAFKYLPRQDPGTPQFRPHLAQDLSVITAACLVVRRDVFLKAGGFDEDKLAVAFNDVDFCLKVEALGYRNLYTPFAELLHHESASRGLDNTPDKVRRFQGEIDTMKARWGERLLNDPAYNPNLSLDSEDFALAYPPRTPPLVPRPAGSGTL